MISVEQNSGQLQDTNDQNTSSSGKVKSAADKQNRPAGKIVRRPVLAAYDQFPAGYRKAQPAQISARNHQLFHTPVGPVARPCSGFNYGLSNTRRHANPKLMRRNFVGD